MSSVTRPEPERVLLGDLHEFALTQPDSIAITHGDVRLTFSELDAFVAETAADLTEALRQAPLPEGSFVPTLMAHDVASVILLLAGLRAGVPIGLIDAALPEAEMTDRLSALGQFGVAMVHDNACSDFFQSRIEVVCAADKPGRAFDPTPVAPDADAFVIFSSGSTGRAKGIVHSPLSVTEALKILGEMLGTGPNRGPIASIGPFHWGGGYAVPLQLCNGRSIAILPIGGTNADSVVEALRDAKVESATLTPSLSVWLARNNGGGSLVDLKTFCLGGELLTDAHIEELNGLIDPTCSIKTIWGASEMCSFFFSPVEQDENWGGAIPIKTEMSDLIRLESSENDPAPIHNGEVGEIIVRKVVAHRYLDQPEFTDLRFGVDPDGVRFWRSGDLAERLPDGSLFLRGRIDDMVKINGKLVEPAESLALLRALPGLRAVEVLPHTYASGRVVLVAHVVADDDVSPDSIRQILMDRLPLYVIPGVLMRHDHLPLTRNGKTDRKALQSMHPVAWLETETHSPDDVLEVFLRNRFQDILETDTIGIDDDLWYLGLDSLGAVEVLATIADIGLGNHPPTMLLEHRTIRSLANKLGGAIALSTSEIVRFNDDIDVDPMFCVPGGGGTAINFQRLAECFSSQQSLFVIEAHGMHTLGTPDRTITAMAERVLAVVTETQPEGPVTLIGYSAGGFVAWEAAKNLAENGRQPRVVLIDSYFDPDSLPSGRNPWGPAPRDLPLLRKFVRACRSRVAGVKNRWREFRPGPPRAEEVRYRAFSRILSKALRHYEPGVATFPVLYLSAEDSPDHDYWKSRAENLTNVEVTGDHLTMLDYPNVELVASTITGWINSLVESEPKMP